MGCYIHCKLLDFTVVLELRVSKLTRNSTHNFYSKYYGVYTFKSFNERNVLCTVDFFKLRVCYLPLDRKNKIYICLNKNLSNRSHLTLSLVAQTVHLRHFTTDLNPDYVN